jgi:hypothetical protein
MEKVKVAPEPYVEDKEISPPNYSTSFLHIVRPRPTPF